MSFLAMNFVPGDEVFIFGFSRVIRFLATQPDLDAYLKRIGSPGPLPADVMQKIGKIKSERP